MPYTTPEWADLAWTCRGCGGTWSSEQARATCEAICRDEHRHR